MKDNKDFKYLICSKKDVLWGVTVDNVGSSEIEANYALYPPLAGHPNNYFFNLKEGRILDNYQLVYIFKGQGRYYHSPTESEALETGDMLVIPPNTWHSYCPDKQTGWSEYWIGLRGEDIDERFRSGFFDARQRVFKIGVSDKIIEYYDLARDVSIHERPGYQQMLAALANLILATVLYRQSNQVFSDDSSDKLMEMARVIMRKNYLNNITPREVAEGINMSYSWFRRMFKEYTNVSPAHYMVELKLQEAKTMLITTNMSIKEISFALNYEDTFYFSTQFKKYSGYSPSLFRQMYRNVMPVNK